MVFPAPVSFCFIAMCSGQPDFSGGVGRNHEIPLKLIAMAFPFAFNQSRN